MRLFYTLAPSFLICDIKCAFEPVCSARDTELEVAMGVPKIAVGCQGGGMHAAFEVGVLTEILTALEQKKFELVGLSGTSAGALCTLMAWYGLAHKKDGSPGSAAEAIRNL